VLSLGKNLKVYDMLRYQDSSLVFVDHIVGHKNKNIFNNSDISTCENLEYVVCLIKNGFCEQKEFHIPSVGIDVRFFPYMLYSKNMIMRKLINSNQYFSIIEDKKEKTKVRR